MLIADITLTPALVERLRACGDEEVLHVEASDGGAIVQRNVTALVGAFSPAIIEQWAQLSESEQRRVEGVLAAHREEPFA